MLESVIIKWITKRHILQQAKCGEKFYLKEENTYKLVNNLTVLEIDMITVRAKSLPSQRFMCMEYATRTDKFEALSLGI
jgi:hypothetical protein